MSNENASNSPVLAEVEKAQQALKIPNYSQEEKDYLSGLQIRLERARTAREQKHDEFDGMTYSEYYESNEKGANTYIEPKKNKEDSNYQSGTIRRKLFVYLSELLKFDFFGDINAFDKNDLQIRALGNAAEDVVYKVKEMDNDEEKRFLRFYELHKQGDVFVEKIWDEQFIKQKKITGSKFDGKIEGVNWTTKIKRKFAGPTTNIISGLKVYLGNIRQYDIGKQPYIFTVEIKDYEETKAKFGQWNRWNFVSKTLKEVASGQEPSMLYNNWRLTGNQENKCEIIRYQDKFNNEFAVIINGVLMTPVGLPLPWGYEDYNITQQHLKPINANFAYGSSIVKEMKNNVYLLDDMTRGLHTKFWKSVFPARLNLTGRVVSKRVFMPSAITSGINPGEVPTIDDKETQGITASEFQTVQSLTENIDKNSVGPIPSGEQPSGDPTATEVLTISSQAKTMLGVTIFAATLLEWKLDWLTLFTILENWFNPVDDKLDEARKELKNVYRVISVPRPIDDKGMGRRVVVPVDKEDMPTAEDVRALEDSKEQETGVPHRFIFLDVGEVTSARIIWQITERSKPKANDEMSKLMFNKMIGDAINFFGADVNLPEFESEYAIMWDRDPKKFFRQGTQQVSPMVDQGKTTASSITPPSAEGALGNTIKNTLRQ